MPFQSHVCIVADDVYTGIKHNGASARSLYLLEKTENKTNQHILGLKGPGFVSVESELSFQK